MSFAATPRSGSPPLDVSFRAVATDPDGSITKYKWNFGDGTSIYETHSGTADHTYNSIGTFNSKVTVVDDDDATATSSSTPISVAYGPDLVGKCEYYSYDDLTKKATLRFRVTNTGSVAAGPFDVAFGLSKSGKLPLSSTFREKSVNGLAPGKSSLIKFDYTFTTSVYGTSIMAIVDSGKQVAEIDEANNGTQIVIRAVETQ